jgi:hypothetical protein
MKIIDVIKSVLLSSEHMELPAPRHKCTCPLLPLVDKATEVLLYFLRFSPDFSDEAEEDSVKKCFSKASL